MRNKIATGIRVEHQRHPTDMPAGVVFTPDRLAQGQRGVERGGGIEGEEVPRDGAAIVVDHHGEPGLGGGFALAHEEHIEYIVISLPDGVGPLSFTAIEQIEALLVGFGTLVSQGRQPGRKRTDNVRDGAVAWWRAMVLLGPLTDPAMDKGHRQRGTLEGQTFNELMQRRRHPTRLVSVGAPLAPEASQPPGVVALDAALQRVRRELVTMSHGRQWLLACQDGLQHVEALHRLRPFLFCRVRQRQHHVRSILMYIMTRWHVWHALRARKGSFLCLPSPFSFSVACAPKMR